MVRAATTTLVVNAANPILPIDVQNHLNTIPVLAGNVEVIGNNGGPFGIKFINDLEGFNVAPMTFAINTGNRSVIQTMSDGRGLAARGTRTLRHRARGTRCGRDSARPPRGALGAPGRPRRRGHPPRGR